MLFLSIPSDMTSANRCRAQSWKISHPRSWIKIIYKSTHDITSFYIYSNGNRSICFFKLPQPGNSQYATRWRMLFSAIELHMRISWLETRIKFKGFTPETHYHCTYTALLEKANIWGTPLIEQFGLQLLNSSSISSVRNIPFKIKSSFWCFEVFG